MVYLLKIVFFHGYDSHNQMVTIPVAFSYNIQYPSDIPVCEPENQWNHRTKWAMASIGTGSQTLAFYEYLSICWKI